MHTLTPREKRSLEALVDTFLPALPPGDGATPAFWARSGADVGVPDALEEVLLTRLRPADARALRVFLRALSTRAGAFALTGSPVPFPDRAREDRERALLALAQSRVSAKRQAFQGVKKLTAFLHMAVLDEAGVNPNWADVGYAAPLALDARADARPVAPVTLPGLDVAALEALRDVDVVVVGSGAGGSVTAARLARAGHRVLVLEAGRNASARDFTGRELDGNDRLYEGHGLFTTRDGSVQILAGAAAGGGTTVNWLTSLAPPAWLRAEWEALGVDGLTGKGFDASVRDVVARVGVSTTGSVVNRANGVLTDGARALGWKEGEDWRVIPRNARGCEARCDTCTFGCPFEAKQDARVTWLADARDAGARFAFDARVTRVLHERGRATGVIVTKAGREVHVRARAVVLAAGAVRSAALLFASGVRARGAGRLFIHPATSVFGRFRGPVRMWEGPPQSIVIDRFADLDGARHGFLLEAVPAHPGLAASALPWRGARAFKGDLARVAHGAGLLVLARDRDPGRVRADKQGMPVVDYRVSAFDARHLVRGMQELARVERAAGARSIMTLHASGVRVDADSTGRIPERAFEDFLEDVAREGVKPNALGLFTAHQMGTIPLGRDGEAPAKATGELRDVEGVWVADASAFPSASGVNPQITIMALAERTSRYLVESLGSRA